MFASVMTPSKEAEKMGYCNKCQLYMNVKWQTIYVINQEPGVGGKHIYDKKKDNGERGIIKRTKK